MMQSINVNGKIIKVLTHPNCPIILNIGNNTKPTKMRFVGIDTNIDYYVKLGYHVASDREFIETYSEYWDYPIGDIKHDYYDNFSDRNNSTWLHFMDAFELIIERDDFLKLCEV